MADFAKHIISEEGRAKHLRAAQSFAVGWDSLEVVRRRLGRVAAVEVNFVGSGPGKGSAVRAADSGSMSNAVQ